MEHQSVRLTKQSETQRARPCSAAPKSSRGESNQPLLDLQGMIGNQGVRRLIQAKLQINEPGDAFEQEADRVADAIVQMPEARVARPAPATSTGGHFQIQRMCSACAGVAHSSAEEEHIGGHAKAVAGGSCESAPSGGEREEERPEEDGQGKMPVMTKSVSADRPSTGNHQRVDSAIRQSGGTPLPSEVRGFMESRFGADFSQVRLHTDSIASEAARELRAEAFASGKDVYFQAGRYEPETLPGRRLLAHELTHVIQQSGGLQGPRPIGVHAQDAGPSIQRFTLTGFPATEEAAMKTAVPLAVSTVKSCSGLNFIDRRWLPSAIDGKEYRYVEDLGLCGWTFPASSYIKIGKKAFDYSSCCDLASTIAHEASHTIGYFEGQARNMECNCFGCSCSS